MNMLSHTKHSIKALFLKLYHGIKLIELSQQPISVQQSYTQGH